MNKEITSLEALENIRKLFIGSPIDLSHQFDIIETALKEWEEDKTFYHREYDKAVEYISHLEMSINELKTALNDECLCKHIISKVCAYLGLDMKSHRDLIETENEILNTLIEAEKKLKALEIIKTKRVNVDFLLDCLQYELDRSCLTQSEYDLLKEVLL